MTAVKSTLMVTAILLAGASPATAQEGMSVPAVFVRDLGVPGQGDGIVRPSAMHFDRVHGELLVADPGHNRIVIFSAAGAFRFAFGLGDSITSPLDLVTDPDGSIYVLGSSQAGRVLQRFDFDGLALERFSIPATLAGKNVTLTHLACDDRGRLYGLDDRGARILDITNGWRVVCDLSPQLADDTTSVSGLGQLVWDRGEFLLPVSTSGFVMRYDTGGRFLGAVGHGGSKPGALAFPVAVQRTEQGNYLVLDKNRFCIVCYSPEGRFLGEFGGKGLSPGWFINPSLLALNGPESAVVGQIFSNRIQIVELPDFVRTNVVGAASINPEPNADIGSDGVASGAVYSSPRRSSTSPYRPTFPGAHTGLRTLVRISSEAST